MGIRRFEEGPEFAVFTDKNDSLRRFRHSFYIKEGTIYMCGNSLGLLSKEAEKSVLNMLKTWKEEGVNMWNIQNNKYYTYSDVLSELMAPLLGADADEVVVLGSTTSNIHQALSTFYEPTTRKYKILVDDINFPTDRYAVDSLVRLKGFQPEEAVKVVRSADGKFLKEDDVIAAMTQDVALILLPTVFYRSAQICNMSKITHAAKKRGIVIGWDVSHAIGCLPMDFKSLDIDFAVWCTYKYLNGGPGSTAGLYINRRHFARLPGLAGWYGNKRDTQFLLRQEFDHQHDASGWQIGTPSLMAMAALEGSLKLIKEAGIREMRKKSLNITAYLMYLADRNLSQYGFKIGNPREDESRGGHVCLEHPEAYRISIALKECGVVPDYRDPNVLRLAPMALYTTYNEVYRMVEILVNIMKTEHYEKFSNKRTYVV